MSEEPKFPLRFKCPNCKSDAGVLQLCTPKEVSEGLLPGDAPVATARNRIVLADEGKLQSGSLIGKKVRVLFYYADVCSKCGQQYIYLVELKEITIPGGAPHGQRIILPDMGPMAPPPGFTKSRDN